MKEYKPKFKKGDIVYYATHINGVEKLGPILNVTTRYSNIGGNHFCWHNIRKGVSVYGDYCFATPEEAAKYQIDKCKKQADSYREKIAELQELLDGEENCIKKCEKMLDNQD